MHQLNDIFTCYSLSQEPFKSVPLIWTIHERTLATRLRQYMSNGQIEFVDDWKIVFNRATVVVFPNHVLPVMYCMVEFIIILTQNLLGQIPNKIKITMKIVGVISLW